MRQQNTSNFVPLHLFASATVSPNSQVAVPAQNLQNPLGGPMEIHEIRIQVTALQPPESANTLFADPADQGALIGVKLDLGTIELTNGFVPAWALGQDINQNAKTQFLNAKPGQTVCQISAYYRWVLPKPLYVPEGATIVPQFQHRGFAPVTVNVGIAYSGRALPRNTPKPQKVNVPWISSYYSTALQLSATATSFDQSSPVDLFNKWDVPVNLHRLTARLPIIIPSIGTWNDWGPYNLNNFYSLMEAKIVDSSGVPVVRRYTPLGEIVNGQTKTWECPGATQAPGDFWSVNLRLNPIPEFAALPAALTILAQTQMALVGYREVV